MADFQLTSPDVTADCQLTARICPSCGRSKYRDSRLCRACHFEQAKGSHGSNWRGGKITLTCKQCAVAFERFPSQQSDFCSVACKNAHGLVSISCAWPGCEITMAARRCFFPSKGMDGFKVDLVRRGQYTKYPICEHHLSRLREHYGHVRFHSIWKVLQDKQKIGRGTSRQVSFVVWERQDGKCATCDERFAFHARCPRTGTRDGTWELDHVVPVFEGGKTTLGNLQALCASCHDTKSRQEKSRASKSRHARTAIAFRSTNYEKNEQLVQLTAKVEELNRAILILFALLARAKCQS